MRRTIGIELCPIWAMIERSDISAMAAAVFSPERRLAGVVARVDPGIVRAALHDQRH